MYLNLRESCLCANILCIHSFTDSFIQYLHSDSLMGFDQSIEFWDYECEEVMDPVSKKEKEMIWLLNIMKHNEHSHMDVPE